MKYPEDFYRQAETKDGLRGTCKACQYKKRPYPYASPQESAFRKLYISCKNSALVRGHSFELTASQHREIINNPCFHCGELPQRFNPYSVDKKRGSAVSQIRFDQAWIVKNGVDRLDNTKGYTEDNCVAACQVCNYSRQDLTVADFLQHCRKIVAYSERRQDVTTKDHTSKDTSTA